MRQTDKERAGNVYGSYHMLISRIPLLWLGLPLELKAFLCLRSDNGQA